MLEQVTADLLAGHDGYRAVQVLPGIGPVLGAVIVAEIGYITRFRHPARLSSWAGLTPAALRVRHQGDPRPDHQDGLALAAALGGDRSGPAHPGRHPGALFKDAIIARRGIQARNIAKAAAARKLLTCVFYAMRDGHVRSLTACPAEQEAG